MGASAADAQTAGSFDCEATAIRGSLLGQPPIGPVTANAGVGECRAASAGGVLPFPATVPLTAAVVSAQTTVNGPAGQVSNTLYGAKGGLADVRVGALPGLPALPLPVDTLPAALTTITIPLPGDGGGGGLPAVPGLPGLPLPGGGGGGGGGAPSSITVDLRAALRAALAARLTAADLLSARVLDAEATARCNGTTPELAGSAQIAGVRVLGTELPTNAVVEQTLRLVDTTSIDPGSLDPSLVTIGGAPIGDPTLAAAVRAALGALPPISIPETVARVKLTPNAQTRTATSLTQQALRAEISIVGQSVLDLTIGEAVVRTTGDPCAAAAEPEAQSVADASLQCTRRRLALIDVVQRRGRVHLYGAADRGLVGRTVNIRFDRKRTVARVKVRRNGTFRTTAKLPPRRLRFTNDARYQAVVGRERSLDLKLHRRLLVQRVRTTGGRIVISGRVVRPLGKPVRTVTIKRRITCRRQRVVKRFKPQADGSFRVSLKAPRDLGVAVYRFQTRVRKNTTNPKTYPTFTLPRAVELQR